MRKPLFLFAIVLIGQMLQAQDSLKPPLTRYYLGPGFGFSQLSLNDQAMSNATFSGPGWTAMLAYQREDEKMLDRTDFYLSQSFLNAGGLDSSSVNWHLRMDDTYVFPIARSKNEQLSFWLGGGDILLWNYRKYQDRDRYDFYYGLAPMFWLRYSIPASKGALILDLQGLYPMISMATRPTFTEGSNDAKTKVYFASVHNHFNPKGLAEITWEFPSSDRIRLGYYAEAYWNRYSEPGSQAVIHTVLATALIRLNRKKKLE